MHLPAKGKCDALPGNGLYGGVVTAPGNGKGSKSPPSHQ